MKLIPISTPQDESKSQEILRSLISVKTDKEKVKEASERYLIKRGMSAETVKKLLGT